jgi:hypothetical protein
MASDEIMGFETGPNSPLEDGYKQAGEKPLCDVFRSSG